jgi:hypothetical protein
VDWWKQFSNAMVEEISYAAVFHHHGNREGRTTWQQGFVEPFISKVQEERLDGRILQPAQQNWRRPGQDDRGYGEDLQGGYG